MEGTCLIKIGFGQQEAGLTQAKTRQWDSTGAGQAMVVNPVWPE